MLIRRGDIFYADLRPVVGSEQGGDVYKRQVLDSKRDIIEMEERLRDMETQMNTLSGEALEQLLDCLLYTSGIDRFIFSRIDGSIF